MLGREQGNVAGFRPLDQSQIWFDLGKQRHTAFFIPWGSYCNLHSWQQFPGKHQNLTHVSFLFWNLGLHVVLERRPYFVQNSLGYDCLVPKRWAEAGIYLMALVIVMWWRRGSQDLSKRARGNWEQHSYTLYLEGGNEGLIWNLLPTVGGPAVGQSHPCVTSCVSLPAFYGDSNLDLWVWYHISSNPARTQLTEALWSDGSRKN